MPQQALKAIYCNSTFILQSAFELPEGTEVELLIQSPHVVSLLLSGVEVKKTISQISSGANAAKSNSAQCSSFHTGYAA